MASLRYSPRLLERAAVVTHRRRHLRAGGGLHVLSVFAEAITQPNGKRPASQFELEPVEAESLMSAIFDAEHRCRELKEKFAAAFERAQAAAEGSVG